MRSTLTSPARSAHGVVVTVRVTATELRVQSPDGDEFVLPLKAGDSVVLQVPGVERVVIE